MIDDDMIYHGGAKPGDQTFADIVAVDSDIIALLAEMAAPVGFTDAQFELIVIPAAALPRERRDGFLRAVAGRLSAEPSDAEVQQAIDATD